jgi:hypothetical protein
MLLVGSCKKCGCTIRLDISSLTREQAIERLSGQNTFSCPGHHVELSAPHPYYWNLDEWELVEGKTPSDEEFVADLRKRYFEVLDAEEMARRGIITGFAFGLPLTNDGNAWDFCESPSGKRWYYKVS